VLMSIFFSYLFYVAYILRGQFPHERYCLIATIYNDKLHIGFHLQKLIF